MSLDTDTSEKSSEDSAVEKGAGRQALHTLLTEAPGVPTFCSRRQRLREAGWCGKNLQAPS